MSHGGTRPSINAASQAIAAAGGSDGNDGAAGAMVPAQLAGAALEPVCHEPIGDDEESGRVPCQGGRLVEDR